jgi:hypothetical protein
MSTVKWKGFVVAVMISALPAGACAQSIDISGFLILEAEWHHNAGGETRVWWEINRLRLDFSSQLSDHVSVLAQFAPVPEEITHQIDQLQLSDGRELPDLDSVIEVEEEQQLIPFERIEVRWQSVAGRWLNLSLGQLRDPFGHWEDFSAHRNGTLTKNNTLVLGIALRNLDMGIQADGDLTDWLDYRVAVRKGNNAGTVNLGREDNNARYDAVGRVGWHDGDLGIGLSGYSVDSRAGKFLQKNTPERLRSLASYIQANYGLASLVAGLRLYALCDYWRLEANSRFEREALNFNAGAKYKIMAEGLTLSLEWGRTYISKDPDPWHVTGQMDVEL